MISRTQPSHFISSVGAWRRWCKGDCDCDSCCWAIYSCLILQCSRYQCLELSSSFINQSVRPFVAEFAIRQPPGHAHCTKAEHRKGTKWTLTSMRFEIDVHREYRCSSNCQCRDEKYYFLSGASSLALVKPVSATSGYQKWKKEEEILRVCLLLTAIIFENYYYLWYTIDMSKAFK